MSLKPIIGFAGLGAMGGGMATNLVKHGFEVHGFDLYKPLVDKFVEAGGKAAATPKAAAAAGDVMVSMVATAAQNTAMLFEGPDAAVDGLRTNATFILCSTTPPAFLAELRAAFDARGRDDVRLLDCPVSGGTLRAADGSLSIFAGAAEAKHIDDVASVLETMSGPLYRMGGLSDGTKTKTVHQLLAATNIIATAEALGLAATVGLNTASVVETVDKSDGASFMFTNRAPHALASDWHPYSALSIILKDTLIVTEAARAQSFATPMASAAEAMYLRGVSAGLLKDDDARLVQLYLPANQPDLVRDMANADVQLRASHQVSRDTIVELLSGIHLAASIEAMAFGQRLGLDRKVLCEIVGKAAGCSSIYTQNIPNMLAEDRWTLSASPAAGDVGKKLSEAVNKCRMIGYPCPMAATALQQFNFAALENKTITGQGRGDRP